MKNQSSRPLKRTLAGIFLAALTCSQILCAPVPAAQMLTSKDEVPKGLSASDWGSIRQQR